LAGGFDPSVVFDEIQFCPKYIRVRRTRQKSAARVCLFVLALERSNSAKQEHRPIPYGQMSWLGRSAFGQRLSAYSARVRHPFRRDLSTGSGGLGHLIGSVATSAGAVVSDHLVVLVSMGLRPFFSRMYGPRKPSTWALWSPCGRRLVYFGTHRRWSGRRPPNAARNLGKSRRPTDSPIRSYLNGSVPNIRRGSSPAIAWGLWGMEYNAASRAKSARPPDFRF
jgi:hypothetical protein